MALATKVISFTAPPVPAGPVVVQQITNVGFQPTLAYLFSFTSANGGNRASFCQGIDDAVTHIARGAAFGVGVARGNTGWTSGLYSMLPVNNNAINVLLIGGKIASFDADGFTVHWTSLNGFSLNIPPTVWVAVLIGGVDAKVGIHEWVGTAQQPVTGVGFRPTGLPFVWLNAGVPGGVGFTGSTGGVDVSVAGTPGCATAAALALLAGTSGAATDTKSRLNSGAFTMDTGGVTSTFDSLDADGFTFTPSVSGVGRFLAYAAVKGCAINCGVFTLTGALDTQSVPITAASPRLVVVLSIDRATSVATLDDLLLSVGAATATEQMGGWTGTLDAKGGAGFTHTRTDTARLLTVATPTGPEASTVVAQASFGAFAAQSFSITKTLTDGVARECIYLVVADDLGGTACGEVNVQCTLAFDCNSGIVTATGTGFAADATVTMVGPSGAVPLEILTRTGTVITFHAHIDQDGEYCVTVTNP